MREEIYQIRRPEHILFGDPLYLDNKERFKNVLIDYQPEKCFDVRLVLKEEPDPQDARFILKCMDLYFAPPQDLKIYMNNRIYQGQQSNSRSYYTEVRKISDDLCRKYGLSIIQPGKRQGKSYAEWMAEKNGKPVWRTAIRSDIREAVNQCFTWNQFLKEMEKRGYQWKLNRKYIALKAPGMERYVRLRSLGEGYSETAVRQRILQPKKIYPSSFSQKNGKRRKKRKGLQALYYSYLYQMGVFPEKPKRIPYEVREDIRRLDQRLAQADFLQKHGIITMGDLQHFQNQLGKDMADLITERRRLYRSSPGSERIREITEQLKPMRKEIRMAVKIAEVSKEMAERMKQAEEREQKQQFSREKDSREERDQKER